ncbi:MAG: polysaccharide biosynthesis tyrosine autokinase, partial [Pseudomonadota bacterium]
HPLSGQDDPYDGPEVKTVFLRLIIRIVLSRKWMISAITIAGMAMAIALTLQVTPMYAATATMEIQRPEAPIIEGSNLGSQVVAGEEDKETLYRLLRSRFLAERIVEELNLANDERYADPNLPRDRRVLQAARRIVGSLRVSPVGRSRVVSVTYMSEYRGETARIANAVVESFIQSNLERSYNTTAFAREFLDDRLASTKLALEESERNLVQYAEAQGILDIGGVNSGSTLDENSIVALNNELSAAESERIKAEQEFRAAEDTPSYRELLKSPTLDALRSSRSAIQTEYEEKLAQFKPDYPDMVRLQTRLDAVDRDIARESESIIASLKVDYEAAVAREESLRSRVQQLRTGLQDDRNRRIQYGILNREVETIRAQYQALLQRSKALSISSGIGSSNVAVVDAALVPGRPFQPNLSAAISQAFFLSFAFGIALAFALNFIDDTVKTPDDLRTKLGIPAIGVVPKLARKKDAILDELAEPKSRISEAFESARTALELATEEGVPKSLLITSTRPGEGKTSTTLALATVFAKGGKSVLIIDADMRKPSFVTDTKKSIGLSGLLTSHESLANNVIKSKTPGLFILPSGMIPPNPAQLLSGPRLQEIVELAERDFDIVILDSPPVLSFADSPRLGSVVEGTLIVVQAGLIRTPSAQRTLNQMYETRSNVLGAVLTKFDARKAGQDYTYYYSSYGYKAYAYVETGSRADSKRKVLIEAAPEEAEHDDT